VKNLRRGRLPLSCPSSVPLLFLRWRDILEGMAGLTAQLDRAVFTTAKTEDEKRRIPNATTETDRTRKARPFLRIGQPDLTDLCYEKATLGASRAQCCQGTSPSRFSDFFVDC